MNKKADVILFYTSVFLLILAFSITYNLLDNDLFSRLIMGKSVVLTGKPMFNDVVSYSATNVWIDHEWLLSGFIYIVATLFNVTGLTVLKAGFFFLWIVFLVFAVKEYPRNLFLYLALIISFVLSQIIYSTVRCQLFTFMALPVWILCLEKIRNDEKNKIKYAFFMVPFMLLWLNCHAGALAALGTVLLYAAGNALNRKPFKLYLIVFVLCALCFLVNPWGIDYVKFLIDTCSTDRSYIGEWQSPFGPLVINLDIFKASYIAVVSAFIYKIIKIIIKAFKKDFSEIKNLDFVKVIVLSFLLVISGKYIKHVYLFMTFAFIYMYGDFYVLYNKIARKIKNTFTNIFKKYVNLEINFPEINFVTFKKTFVYGLIIGFSIVSLKNYPLKETAFLKFDESYPLKALNFIEINDLRGKVLAPYFISGYIAYQGYPKLKIFMDGRQEQLYPQEYIFMNMNLYALQGPYPFVIFEKFRPDIILIENGWPVAGQERVLNGFGFKKVYGDERYGVFLSTDKLKFSYFYPKEQNKSCFDHIFETKILE